MFRFTAGAKPGNWNERFSPHVAGIYLPATGEIHLSPRVCLALNSAHNVRPDGFENKRRLADAVQTLAHEAEHAHGIGNEKRASCYGMPNRIRSRQDQAREKLRTGSGGALLEVRIQLAWLPIPVT